MASLPVRTYHIFVWFDRPVDLAIDIAVSVLSPVNIHVEIPATNRDFSVFCTSSYNSSSIALTNAYVNYDSRIFVCSLYLLSSSGNYFISSHFSAQSLI